MIQRSHSWACIQRKLYWKRYMHPYIHSSSVHINQDTEATWTSIDRGADRGDALWLRSGMFLSR